MRQVIFLQTLLALKVKLELAITIIYEKDERLKISNHGTIRSRKRSKSKIIYKFIFHVGDNGCFRADNYEQFECLFSVNYICGSGITSTLLSISHQHLLIQSCLFKLLDCLCWNLAQGLRLCLVELWYLATNKLS